MGRPRRFTLNQLIEAVKNARNWKEFLYELHIEDIHRDTGKYKALLIKKGIDFSHFSHKSYYTEKDFVKASEGAISCIQIARRLGLETTTGAKFRKLLKKYRNDLLHKPRCTNNL